jgi:hypothetical protein
MAATTARDVCAQTFAPVTSRGQAGPGHRAMAFGADFLRLLNYDAGDPSSASSRSNHITAHAAAGAAVPKTRRAGCSRAAWFSRQARAGFGRPSSRMRRNTSSKAISRAFFEAKERKCGQQFVESARHKCRPRIDRLFSCLFGDMYSSVEHVAHLGKSLSVRRGPMALACQSR